MLRTVDLVDRLASDLADSLKDVVHAVDIRLAEQTAMGIDGERALEVDMAFPDEVPRLAGLAEAIALELHEDDRAEVLVDRGHVDLVRAHP